MFPWQCLDIIIKYCDKTQIRVLRTTSKQFLIYKSEQPTVEEWVKYGSTTIMKLLKLNLELSKNLAKYGYLETLKWARENGCPWNKWTCSSAAQNGYLEILKWARENGCGWDGYTCTHAVIRGHLDVLKWARENGCEWDSNTCKFAAKGGHLEVLKWLGKMVVNGIVILVLMLPEEVI